MFYPTPTKSFVPPFGRPNSRIALVGDFVTGYDLNRRLPFQGPDGKVLDQCLHNAGLIRGEVYITYLCKEKMDVRDRVFSESKGTFTSLGEGMKEELRQELLTLQPNVIVAMGQAPFAALCSTRYLSKYRGYLFESTLLPGRKVIPTYAPWSAVRGQYLNRYIIAHDLKKAREESKFPELRRPDRTLVLNIANISDALSFLKEYEDVERVGFDIEVINYEVSCISFSSSPDFAVVIPIAGIWTLEEEMEIWKAIQRVLGNPNSKKVVQNGIFDIFFLWSRNGIVVRGEIEDTMVAHSILFPELPKGLGFLGSLYCGAQEYWKDTVKFTNIKGES